MADTNSKTPLNFDGVAGEGAAPTLDQSGTPYNFDGLDAIGPDTEVAPQKNLDAPVLSEDDLALLGQRAEEHKKYANRPGEAAALSALGTASWSLSDRLLEKLGIRSQEDLNKISEYNKSADLAGVALGTIAPMFVEGPLAAGGATGRGAGAALNAASKFGKLSESVVEGALAGVKNKALAKEIVRKSIASGAGSAVEGAAFGLQQLAREEALGDAEFNADNLMGAVGTGAIYGGLIGAATPSMAAAAKGLTKGASDLLGKSAAKTLDRVENAAELVGETQKQKAAALSNPLRAAERNALPDILAEEVAAGAKIGNDVELLSTWQKLNKSTREALGDFYKKVDEIKGTVGYSPNVPMQTSEILLKKLNTLENEIVEPLLRTRSGKSMGSRLKDIADDYKDWIAADPYPSAQKMWAKRKEFDKLAKWEATKPTQEMEFFKALRSDLDDHLKAYVEGWQPGLKGELEKLNLRARVAMRYMGSIEKKAAKDFNPLKMADYPYAILAGGFHSPVAMGLLGAKKFMESDFKRRLVVLSGIEKANKAVLSQMKSAVSNFTNTVARPARSLSTKALIQSKLSFDHENNAAPKGKQQAFENVQKNLIKFKTNPEQLLERTQKTSALVAGGAPKTAEVLGDRMIGAINFLYDKMPKNPYDVEMPGISGREYKPSAAELSKFERYVQVVESPISTLNELEAGTLTRDHVEALQAVYPAFYKKLQQEVHEAVVQRDANGEPSLPYNKRVQLGILFGQPTDSSMTGPSVLSLQSTFQPAQDQRTMQAAEAKGMVAPSQGGLQGIDIAQRTAGGAESAIRRRTQGT